MLLKNIDLKKFHQKMYSKYKLQLNKIKQYYIYYMPVKNKKEKK